jgi:hypothetical protein
MTYHFWDGYTFNFSSYYIQILLYVKWIQVTECFINSVQLKRQESRSVHFYCHITQITP